MNNNHLFWARWLEVMCAICIVLGVVLALVPQVTQSTMGIFVYDTVVGEGTFAALTEAELATQNLLYGVMGSLMVAWMIVIGWLVHVPFRRGERWAWLALDVSIFAWFIIDSVVSASNGMPVNVLFNLVFLLLFAIPLLATWTQFRPFGRAVTASA